MLLAACGGNQLAIEQRPDQISGPDKAQRGARQRFEGGVATVRQIDHVMTEMGKHSGEI